MRTAELIRKTKETEIKMTLAAEGAGGLDGSCGVGFFDHMLNSFCVHSGFDIKLELRGDLHVDAHHTVEDTGIVLGKLLAEIIAKSAPLTRFGNSFVPMDECLAQAVTDLSGRPYLVFDADFRTQKIGAYETQLTKEFFRALAFNMGATLHLRVLYGENDHHKTEALFKAAARAISEAMQERDGEILSAKKFIETVDFK